MKRVLLLAVAMGLSSGFAYAQTSSPMTGPSNQEPPAARGPSSEQDVTGTVTRATQEFVEKVAASDRFEIESSRLALQKTRDPKLKEFARHMVEQHTQSTTKLKAAVIKARLPAMTPKLDAKEQAQLDELKSARAEGFDRKYITAQQAAHSEAIVLFQAYLSTADAPAIAAFARDVLPIIQQHKRMIEQIAGV